MFHSIKRKKDNLCIFAHLTDAALKEKLEWLKKHGFNIDNYYIASFSEI